LWASGYFDPCLVFESKWIIPSLMVKPNRENEIVKRVD